jgi:hypothetical protein
MRPGDGRYNPLRRFFQPAASTGSSSNYEFHYLVVTMNFFDYDQQMNDSSDF